MTLAQALLAAMDAQHTEGGRLRNGEAQRIASAWGLKSPAYVTEKASKGVRRVSSAEEVVDAMEVHLGVPVSLAYQSERGWWVNVGGGEE